MMDDSQNTATSRQKASETGSPAAMRARVSAAYAAESRHAQEEKWILDHLPLVRHIVHRIAGHVGNQADIEDLISAGTLGLIKAARAYDPSKDAVFKTYAYIRVRGAVIDELRGRSFAPASVHGQVRRIRQAYEQYAAAHGHPPDDEQLAAEVGISLGQLYRTLEEARRQHFLSIHGLTDDSPELGVFIPPDDAPGPEDRAERKEMLERLAEAIRTLPQRDRLVLLLYYERDLTMKETAAVLGVTESRVSQLHAGALFKLSVKLGANHEQQ
ncbi:MAG: FliA/WhiG family RNA polymerase sigma factor [Phycisphaerae bacterium]|nr:FliA/WhiG family RNA polymerase sigma factor [Phycisphaerae bacterium]